MTLQSTCMRPMLAGKYTPTKIATQLPMFGQPKLDGIRMFIRDGVAYTRSLKPVRSVWVQKLVKEAGSIVDGLDGEIIAGEATAKDCYRRTCSSVMSHMKQDDVSFHVFDFWKHPGKFIERNHYLNSLNLPEWCKLVDTELLHSMEEISIYQDIILSKGYEGIVLRSVNGLYKHGRGTPTSGELIKLKQFHDTEARITGFIELLHNDNEAEINALGYMERTSHQENLVGMKMLGAITAEGNFPNGTPYKIRIGTGFDMAQRQEIWDNQSEYLGKLVKFKYFPCGMKEAPRFPVFLGFRDPDDLSPNKNQGDLFN